MMKPILLVTTMAALAASAALAQAPQSPPAPQRSAPASAAAGGLDPNETICRSESEVGSRLRRHRTCVTRAQWAERERQDRQYLEKAQTNRVWCKNGPCPP